MSVLFITPTGFVEADEYRLRELGVPEDWREPTDGERAMYAALTAAQAEIASLWELLAVAEGALGAAATALESTKGPPFGLATHVRDTLTAIRAAKEKTDA